MNKTSWAAVASVLLVAACASPAAPQGGSTATPNRSPAPPSATLQPSAAAPTSTIASNPAATPTVAATPTAAAMPSVLIDVSAIDACAFLDESDVQALTGTSHDFTNSGSQGTCFWGVTSAGEPAYVEIKVFRSAGLANWFRADAQCTVVPVTSVAGEATGRVCDNPQHKVELLVRDQSAVTIGVLVNEPERALEPADLGPIIEPLLAEVLSGT